MSKATELINSVQTFVPIMASEIFKRNVLLVTHNDFTRIVTDLCTEIETLKKANEWILPLYMPEIGESMLVKYKHLTGGGERHEVDIVVNDHDGNRIFSMQGYEDIIIIGYKLIN